jgi:hypothetical protein
MSIKITSEQLKELLDIENKMCLELRGSIYSVQEIKHRTESQEVKSFWGKKKVVDETWLDSLYLTLSDGTYKIQTDSALIDVLYFMKHKSNRKRMVRLQGELIKLG